MEKGQIHVTSLQPTLHSNKGEKAPVRPVQLHSKLRQILHTGAVPPSCL